MGRKTNNTDDRSPMPLHGLTRGDVTTAGRLSRQGERWFIENAHTSVPLATSAPLEPDFDGALVRIEATWTGELLEEADIELVHTPTKPRPELGQARELPLAEAYRFRAWAVHTVRRFFDVRGFQEVETPNWVRAPGTDVHLDPVRAIYEDFAGINGSDAVVDTNGSDAVPGVDTNGSDAVPGVDTNGSDAVRGYLHTSPEFAMKRLLAEGFEQIWQMTKVWRNGEVGPLHNPEFTILEWYRAWEPVETIIDDVESLAFSLLRDEVTVVDQGGGADKKRTVKVERPFRRMTMQELVDEACGFDLLDALEFDELLGAVESHDLLPKSSIERAHVHRRWDELFFELQVTHLDAHLADQGAVFVTHWPTKLAVLARKNPDDPRVADRFELYVGGVELANGFQELTDPVEQRERFAADNITRRERGLPELPMPERFLEALEWGMPPASGVALGLDRIIMLTTDVADIREVAPFAMRRDAQTGGVVWG